MKKLMAIVVLILGYNGLANANRVPLSEYIGVRLNESHTDVVYELGRPTVSFENMDRFDYSTYSLNIIYNEGKVSGIWCTGKEYKACPAVWEIEQGMTIQELQHRLGKPDNIFIMPDNVPEDLRNRLGDITYTYFMSTGQVQFALFRVDNDEVVGQIRVQIAK